MGMGGTAVTAGATLNITGFIASLQQMVSQTNASVNSIQTRLQVLEQAGNRAFASMSASSKAASKGIGADWDVLTGAERKVLEVQTAFNGLFRTGSQLAQVGQTIGLMGGALLAVGAAARKSADDFDFWTRRAAAAAAVSQGFQGLANQFDGVDASAGKMNARLSAMKNTIEAVTVSVGAIPAGEVAQSFYLWESATGDVIDSQEKLNIVAASLEHILKASVVAGLDAQTTIRGVSQVLSAFGLSTEYASHVTNVLLNTSQITNVEFGEMIESFKQMGGVARALGIPIEELSAGLGALANAGQRGSAAGRGFQRLLMGVVDPTKQGASALQELLGKYDQLENKWQNVVFKGGQFIGIIDKINSTGQVQKGLISVLADATENLNQAEAVRLVGQFTTENAARIILPLLTQENERRRELIKLENDLADARRNAAAAGQQETESTQAATKALDDFKNAHKTLDEFVSSLESGTEQARLFDEQWNLVSNSIRVVWGREMQRLNFAFMELGTAAQGALIPLLQNINRVVGAIRGWARDNSDLFQGIVRIVALVAGILTVAGALGFLIGNLIQLSTVIHMFGSAFAPLLTVISSSISTFGLLGISILAVIGAVIYVAHSSQQAWDAFTNTLHAAVSDGIAVVSYLAGTLIQLGQAFASGDWGKVWQKIADIAITAIAYFALYAPQLIQQAFAAIIQLIDTWTNGAATTLLTAGQNLMIQLANGIMDGIEKYILPVIRIVSEVISSFFRGASPPKVGPLKGIRDWGANLVKSLSDGMKDGLDHADDAAEHIGNRLAEKLEGHSPPKSGPLKDIKKWGANVSKAYADGIKDSMDQHDDAANAIGKKLSKKLEGHSPADEGPLSQIDTWPQDLMKVYAQNLEEAGKQELEEATNRIGEYLKQKFSGIDDELIPTVELTAKNIGTSFLDSMFASFKQGDFTQFDEMTDLVKKNLENVYSEATAGLGDKIADKQKQLGIAEALFGDQGKLDQAKEAIATTIQEINNGVKDFSQLGKISAILGTDQAANDFRDLVNAMSDVHQAEGIKKDIEDSIKATQQFKDAIQTTIEAIRARIDAIRGEKAPWQAIIDAAKEHIDQLNLEKDLLQDEIDKHRENIDRINDEKQAIQDNIDSIRERQDAERETVNTIEESIKHEQDEKSALQDQLNTIKDKYDAQREADKAHIDALDLQAEKLKLQDSIEEQSIQREINKLKLAGGSPAQIANLQKQLELTKAKHDVDEKDLDLQKQQADVQSKDAETGRTAAQKAEEDVVKSRVDAIDKQISANEHEKEVVEDRIKQLDKSIQAAEKQDKALDKQIRVENDAIKTIEKREKVIDDEIKVENRRSAAAQKEIDAIEKRAKQVEDTDLKQAQHLSDEADHELKRQRMRLDAANVQVDAAKEELAIQRNIISEHQKLLEDRKKVLDAENALADAQRKEAEKKQKEGEQHIPGAPTGLGPGSSVDQSPEDLAAGLEARGKELQEMLKNMFAPLGEISPELQAKKEEIGRALDELRQRIADALKPNKEEQEAGDTTAFYIRKFGENIKNAFDDVMKGDFNKALLELQTIWLTMQALIQPYIDSFFSWIGTQIHDGLDRVFGQGTGDRVSKFTKLWADDFSKLGGAFAKLNIDKLVALVAVWLALITITGPLNAGLALLIARIPVLNVFLSEMAVAMDALLPTLTLFGLTIAPWAIVVAAAAVAVGALAAAVATAITVNPGPLIEPLARLGIALAFISEEITGRLTTALANLAPMWDMTAKALGPLTVILGQTIENLTPVLLVLVGILGGVLQAAIQGFGTAFMGLMLIMGGTLEAILGVFNLFAGTIVNIIKGIIGIVRGLITGDWSLAMEAWQDLIKNAFNSIAAIGHGFSLIFQGIIEATIVTIGMIIGGFVQGIIDYFQHLFDVLVGHSIIPDMMNAILDWFTHIPNQILDFISGWIDTLLGAFGKFGSDLIESVTTTWNNVWEVINTKLSDINTIINQVWGDISTFIDGILNGENGILPTITKAWENIKTGIDTVLNGEGGIFSIINVAWTAINTFITGIMDDKTGLQFIIQTAWNNITGVISSALSEETGIRHFVNEAFNAVATKVSEVMGVDDNSGIRGIIIGAWNSVLQFIKDHISVGAGGGIVELINNAMSAITDAIKPAADAVQGFLNKLRDLWDFISNHNFNVSTGGGGGGNGGTPGNQGGEDNPFQKIANTLLGGAQGSNALLIGQQKTGLPYVWGGPGGRIPGVDSGFDCSGFVSWVYQQIGKPGLPAFTDSIYNSTSPVEGEPRLGDIVLYEYNDSQFQPGVRFPHVGLYAGPGRVLDARSGSGVGYHNDVQGAKVYYRRYHTGGFIDKLHNGLNQAGDELTAILQRGEMVLSRSDVAKLQNLYGQDFLPSLLAGTARARSTLNGITSAVSTAGAPSVKIYNEQSGDVTLQVGVLVADERGLRELERRLQGVRIVEDARTGRSRR